MSGKQPTIVWNLGSRAQNVTNEIRSFVVALFVAAHLTRRYVFSGGNQPPAHGGHGGLKGVKVVLVDQARNTFKLTVQPGENNTRREFMVLVDGHTAEHVVNQIKAVIDAAKTRKKSRRKGASSVSVELTASTPSSALPPPTETEPQRVRDLFSKSKSDLSQAQQAKLIELQAVITPAEFAQLQLFLENGWVTQLNGWVHLRLGRSHLAFLPTEMEDLVAFLDKLMVLGLASHAGHSHWGVDLEAEQCVEMSSDLFTLIPHLTDPSVGTKSITTQPVVVTTSGLEEEHGVGRRLASNKNPVWFWLIQPGNLDQFLLALAGLIESLPSKMSKGQVAVSRIVKAVMVLPGLQARDNKGTKVFTWALARLLVEHQEMFTIDTATGIEFRTHRVGLTDAGRSRVRDLRGQAGSVPTTVASVVKPELAQQVTGQAELGLRSSEIAEQLKQMLVEIRQAEKDLENNMLEKARLEQERVDLQAKIQKLEEELSRLTVKLKGLRARHEEIRQTEVREQAIQVELGRLGGLPSDVLAGVLEQLAARLRVK